MRIRQLDHLAIAVSDIDEALAFYRDALGLEVSHMDVEAGQGVRVAFMPLGDQGSGSEIELIEPIEADSGVARYLDKRGAGMHHICLEVDDLDAALARLQAADVELIGDAPYVNRLGRRLVFIHPRSTFGVLIELYEAPSDEGAGAAEADPESVEGSDDPDATDRTPAA